MYKLRGVFGYRQRNISEIKFLFFIVIPETAHMSIPDEKKCPLDLEENYLEYTL